MADYINENDGNNMALKSVPPQQQLTERTKEHENGAKKEEEERKWRINAKLNANRLENIRHSTSFGRNMRTQNRPNHRWHSEWGNALLSQRTTLYYTWRRHWRQRRRWIYIWLLYMIHRGFVHDVRQAKQAHTHARRSLARSHRVYQRHFEILN